MPSRPSHWPEIAQAPPPHRAAVAVRYAGMAGAEILATFGRLDAANAIVSFSAAALTTKAGILAAARDHLENAKHLLSAGRDSR